jgi:hypothetical protein
MPYTINEHEMKAVSALDGVARYAHFIKRVADWMELWSLKGDDGFVGSGDGAGNTGIPFWPHPAYAEQQATGEWANCAPALIGLDDFMKKWLAGMERDGLKVFVFPTPNLKGVMVEPARLRADLIEEMKQYE